MVIFHIHPYNINPLTDGIRYRIFLTPCGPAVGHRSRYQPSLRHAWRLAPLQLTRVWTTSLVPLGSFLLPASSLCWALPPLRASQEREDMGHVKNIWDFATKQRIWMNLWDITSLYQQKVYWKFTSAFKPPQWRFKGEPTNQQVCPTFGDYGSQDNGGETLEQRQMSYSGVAQKGWGTNFGDKSPSIHRW